MQQRRQGINFPERCPVSGPASAWSRGLASLFDVPIGWAVAAFLALAALDHLLTATVYRGTYEGDLKRGINRFRWVEYSVSATLMVILISFYSGITSINAVIAVAGANVGMILFGWIQELMNPPGRTTTTMLPFWFGTVVGLASPRRGQPMGSPRRACLDCGPRCGDGERVLTVGW